MGRFLKSVQKQFPNLYRLEVAVLEARKAIYTNAVKDA